MIAVDTEEDDVNDKRNTIHHHRRRSSILSVLLHGSDAQKDAISPLRTEFNDSPSQAQAPTSYEYEEDNDLSTGVESPGSPESELSSGLNSAVSIDHKTQGDDFPVSPGTTNHRRLGFRKKSQKSSIKEKRPPLQKQMTSAFLEGIKAVSAEEASKSASYSGWMNKRGGVGVGSWKSRYFTLHGTRLSYFTSFEDAKEKGLIDINSHRVLACKENEDKLIALYAASVGSGRFCFKLVPPVPGSRKGVTFTAPKVHYFAVDSRDEMRNWMAAIMKATIDRDESVPALSSCATPTVSLSRAQELFADARSRDEDLRAKMVAGGLSGNNISVGTVTAGGYHMKAMNVITSNPSPPITTAITAGTNEASFGSNPDSPSGPSSLRSSRTGSSGTNSSSLKLTNSGTSPKDFSSLLNNEMRHVTPKTAGLKIVTDLEDPHSNFS